MCYTHSSAGSSPFVKLERARLALCKHAGMRFASWERKMSGAVLPVRGRVGVCVGRSHKKTQKVQMLQPRWLDFFIYRRVNSDKSEDHPSLSEASKVKRQQLPMSQAWKASFGVSISFEGRS